MDALDIVIVCVRRWWVMLPVLVLAALTGINMTHQQKPVYFATGGYALVYMHSDSTQPGSTVQDSHSNPLASNGGSLIGEALIADYMSRKTQVALGGTGNSGTAPGEAVDGALFTVLPPTYGMATYYVKTWGPEEKDVRAVVDGVLAAAPAKAADIQKKAGAPEQSQYTTFVTAPTQVTEMPAQSGTKMILAVSALGLMAGAALSLVVDRMIKRRGEKSGKRAYATAARVTSEGTTRRTTRSAHRARRSSFGKVGSVQPDLQPSHDGPVVEEPINTTTTLQAQPTLAVPTTQQTNGATAKPDWTQGLATDAELQVAMPSSVRDE